MRRTEILPVFVTDFIPEVLQEGILYISLKYETASHKCPCGCGELVVTPLKHGWWNLTRHKEEVSLHPSIGNFKVPCKSHYWIKENKIVWC